MPDTLEMIQQHRELITLCRRLDEAVRRRQPRAEIYRIMDELIACTDHHFQAEERLMAEAGYPELKGHKAKHKELLERTRKFRRRLDLYGEESFTEWFNHWPFPFILAHIQNGDRQIGDYIHHTTPSTAPAGTMNAAKAPDMDAIKVPKELYARHMPPDGAAAAHMAAEHAGAAPYPRGQED